jgi:hypothetical protein
MIGLTAAVYANRPRIFFIPDILLILFFLRFLFKKVDNQSATDGAYFI